MQPIQVDQARDSRLRFVFSDTVISLGLAADATFGEVARKLGRLSRKRYGNPVAIDVTLAACEDNAAGRMSHRRGPETSL